MLKVLKFGEIKFDFEYDEKTISALEKSSYVYFVLSDTQVEYKHEKSRVIYIGKTTSNAWEMLTSGFAYGGLVVGIIEKKIKQVCNSCSFYFTAIEESGSPDDAERAFLYLFKEIYGDIPKCNTQGSGYGEEVMEEFERKFNVSREELKKILRGLETM